MAGKKKVDVVETVSESSVAEPIQDITDVTNGLWPGNPPNRVGSYYCNLHKMNLKAGEKGLFCALPEGFVLERADVHGIEVPDNDLQINIQLEGMGSVGIFHQKKDQLMVKQIAESQVFPGEHVGHTNVYIRAEKDIPDKGRILISFVGYQIETWR